MKIGILDIIDYLSKYFFGTKNDPADVELKYITEDERYPYWYIKIDTCHSFEELKSVNDAVEKAGYKLDICVSGVWVQEKELVEAKKAERGY